MSHATAASFNPIPFTASAKTEKDIMFHATAASFNPIPFIASHLASSNAHFQDKMV